MLGYKFQNIDIKFSPADKNLLKKQDLKKYIKYFYIPWKKINDQTYFVCANPSKKLVKHLLKEYGGKINISVTTKSAIIKSLQNQFSDYFLDKAINLIINKFPQNSAHQLLNKKQFRKMLLFGTILLIIFFLEIIFTLKIAILFAQLVFFCNSIFKIFIFRTSYENKKHQKVRMLENKELSIYSILLPMYKECKTTIKKLVENLEKLDYPKHKLDIIFLVEQYDRKTILAIRSLKLNQTYKVICVPLGLPKTKPRACNYGLNFAIGKYVTIYDAEDAPDPKQLRLAASYFSALPENYACLQARLNFYNKEENLLTKFFSMEYKIWFNYLLYGLEQENLPIPLGGNSNHFKMKYIKKLGGWDSFNVTEDADLGMRIYKYGFRTKMLDSNTLEESPISIWAWLRQRARWIKGHFQTSFVHFRSLNMFTNQNQTIKPMLGFIGFISLPVFSNLMFVLTILISLFFHISASAPKFYEFSLKLSWFNLFIFIISKIFMATLVSEKKIFKQPFISVICFPIYTLLHPIATIMALFDLLYRPHHWRKTQHNFHQRNNKSD